MGVGASVGPGGEVHVMVWDNMSVCEMPCAACGVECGGVQPRGRALVAMSYPSVRITATPTDRIRFGHVLCILLCFPCLVPCMFVCVCL